MLARGKEKYKMNFGIRYFFLETGLSPSGLTKSQENVSNFKPHYILPLLNGSPNVYIAIMELCRILKRGWVGLGFRNSIWGQTLLFFLEL